MSFAQRLSETMMEQGISTYRMSNDTGIPEATIGRWKNGKAVPTGENLVKVVKYLDISADYLLFGKLQKERPSAEAKSLSEIEKEIFEIYHTLPEDKKQAFMTVARSLKSQSKDK